MLDLGGGPGRYTRWLAEQGHRVTLADLSPALLNIAREEVSRAGLNERIELIVEADARDLSRWPADTFNAVLALGPFYHLPGASDRDQAARELARVLRAGGVAFVALIPRYAFLRRTLAMPDERRRLTDPAFIASVLKDGVFINDLPGRFTGGYGVRPEEVAPFFERYGFQTCALLSCEGIVADMQEHFAEATQDDPAFAQALLELIIQTASDPSLLGMSRHLLYVAHLEDTPRS